MWDLLQKMKTALTTIPELDTVLIGTEKGINAKSCPAARIVLESREYESPQHKTIDSGDIHILLLLDLKNNIEENYQQSIELEEKIRNTLAPIVAFNRTDYDQDGVSVFKATRIAFTFNRVSNGNTGVCNDRYRSR